MEGQAGGSRQQHIEAAPDVVKHRGRRIRAFTAGFTLFTNEMFA